MRQEWSIILIFVFIFLNFQFLKADQEGPKQANKHSIEIVSLSATPNPFCPMLNPVEIVGTIEISAENKKPWKNLINKPIFWIGGVSFSETLVESEISSLFDFRKEGIFSKLLSYTFGSGSSVQFQWDGTDLKGNRLEDGIYRIWVLAWSPGIGYDFKSIDVKLDQKAPVITITLPQNGYLTNQSMLEMQGTIDDLEANLWVNENQVAIQSDGRWTARVGLVEGANHIQIKAKNEAGNESLAFLEVVLVTRLPTLTISSPSQGFVTNVSSITVTGQVNESDAKVFINGTQIEVSSDGQFSHSVNLSEGANSIFIRAEDAVGNTTQMIISVTLDTEAPVITIHSPEDGSTIGSSLITISGSVNESVSLLNIQGQDVAVASDLSFSISLNLFPDQNIIEVRATDFSGNAGSKSFTITYDNASPQIIISSPKNETWTNQTSVTVVGTVDDLHAKVWVQGLQVSVSEIGAFSQEATLSDSTNTILVEAQDIYENRSSQEITIYFDATPPTITINPSGEILPTAEITLTVSYMDLENGIELGNLKILVDGSDWTNFFSMGETQAQYTPQPPLNEGEHSWSASIKDKAGNETTVGGVFTIQAVDPPEVTEDSSYIDGVVYDSDTDLPIQGVHVTIEGLTGAVLTDIDGNFGFPVPESILYRIRISKNGYIEAGRRIKALKTRDVGLGKIYLKKEDPQKTTISSEGGIAEDSRGLIQIIVPANAVNEALQVGATWFDKGRELPGPLPESSQFTYAMELSPDGATFNQPLTIKFKNTRGFPVGSNIPVGYWVKSILQWVHESIATVTADGQWVEYQVTHFSPRDVNISPPPTPGIPTSADGEENEEDESCDCPPCGNSDSGNSTVDYLMGNLRESLELVSHRTLGKIRSHKLYYNSEYINSYFRARISKSKQTTATKVPDRVGLHVGFEGEEQSVYTEGTLDPFAANFILKKENARRQRLPTGLYQWKGRASYDYLGLNFWYTSIFGGPPETDSGIPMDPDEYAQYGTNFYKTLVNVNEIDSPFGAGWQLEGLERLYEDPANGGYVVIGSGSYQKFSPQYHVFTSFTSGAFQNGLVKGIDSVTDSIQLNYNAYEIGLLNISPDGKKLYIGGEDNDIRVVDLATGLFIKKINIGSTQNGFAFSPDAKKMFVAGGTLPGGSTASNIYVIDTTLDSVISTIQTSASAPKKLLVSPDGKKLYVSRSDQNNAWFDVYSTESYALLNRIQLIYNNQYGLAADSRPMTMSPDGKKVYVFAIGRNSNDQDGYVAIIDGTTNQLTNIIRIPYIPNDVAMSPNGAYVFVAGQNFVQGYVTVLDIAKDLVIGNITVGKFPKDIKLNPDGTRAYVAVDSAKRVSVIDLEKLTVISQISLNSAPTELVIRPDGKKVYVLLAGGGVKIGLIDTISNTVNTVMELTSSGNVGHIEVTPELTKRVIALDESIIVKQEDGTYIRTYKDQSKDHFDAEGYKVKNIDSHGNITEYIFETINNQKRLQKIVDPTAAETRFTYSLDSKLQNIQDPQGRLTQFQIDQNGNLTQLTHPDGSNFQFKYDNEHRLTEKTTPRNFTTKYTYGAYGQITKIEAPTDEIREYIPAITDQIVNEIPGALDGEIIEPLPYNAKGAYSQKMDGLGNIWKTWLDANGRETKIEDPLGRITEYEYTGRGHLTKLTHPNGAIETRAYDVKGNLVTKTLQDIAATTTYTYDNTFNKPTSITNALGNKTTLEYDSTTGDLKKVTDALNNIWTFTYIRQGLLEMTTDPEGHVTSYIYDALGNLAAITDALTHTWNYSRDSAGNLTTMTDPLGNVTGYSYNFMNKLISITDAEGGVTQMSYEDTDCDSCVTQGDLITSITDPNGNTYHFEYNEIGQLAKTIDPLGNETIRAYDLNRNLSSITDANGNVTNYSYDPANQLISETVANGGVIMYSYNDSGKRSSLTDPNGNTTSYSYDLVERLISEIDPLGNATQYYYDKIGNLIEKINAKNQSISYQYDKLKMMTQKTTPEQTYAFGYDSLGRLTSAVNGVSVLGFAYDAVGQLTDATTGASQPAVTLYYAYDSSRREIQLTDPTGTTHYEYDRANRLVQIRDPLNNIFGFEYDLAGRRTKLSGPGGIERNYSYDAANRLLELINKANGVEVDSFQHSYDAVGNKTKTIDRFGSHDYVYDSVYRLLNATNINESFRYDQTGNRTSDLTQTYSYNEINQLISGSNGLSLTYDANRNVISKTGNGLTWTYTWNSENQLIQAISSSGKIITFQYDPLGRRISKTSNGTTRQWMYDGDHILLEYTDDTLTGTYSDGAWIDELLVRTDLIKGQNYYYHTDALGSTTVITNSSGSVVESYRYTVYGSPTLYDQEGLEISESGIGNSYLFTGREYDPETKLQNSRARYYDPSLGRFISADPIGFSGGINLYEYVYSSPLNWTDAYGLFVGSKHEEITENTLDKFGASESAKNKITEGNLYVDRFENFTNNNQHGMREVGQNPVDAFMESQKFEEEKLKNAVEALKEGDLDKSFHELGQGTHCIQDEEAHEFITLPNHLANPRHLLKDRFPGSSRLNRARNRTEEYIRRYLKEVGSNPFKDN